MNYNSIMEMYSLTGAPMVCCKKTMLRVLSGQIGSNGYHFPLAILHTEPWRINYRHFTIYDDAKLAELGDWYGEVWVSKQWDEQMMENLERYNIDKTMTQYLTDSIVGKRVFAPTQILPMHFLPTCPICYLIVGENGMTEDDILRTHNGYYKEVRFTDETCIADLYINAWKYTFEPSQDCFIRLTEHGAWVNALHGYMQATAMRYGGTAYDRIADLSRLVTFLLSKVNLTEEERNIIQPLINEVEPVNDLGQIVDREAQVHRLVKSIKDDPLGFIAKQKDITEEDNGEYEWWV